jgi:tetratricopeptide (TPR) repeat protein
MIAAGMVTVGLAIGTLEMLWIWSDVNEVAPSCGFAFSMLALAAIWRSLSDPKGRLKWLLLASLAFGLAIGASPTWLFGAIILLAPAVHAWRTAVDRSSRWRAGWLLLAAAGPVTFIGLGLMVYNVLRFDNPFEFGLNYQITGYTTHYARLFSVHYFWFDLRFYFLGWMRWGGHFPFLQMLPMLPVPAGAYGAGNSYGGILALSPVVWLALAVPLAWRRSRGAPVSILRWFLAVTVLLFAIEMVTICLFFAAFSRCELEFLPPLVLLSVIGLLELESVPADATVWRRIARPVGRLLLAGSIVFNLLAIIAARAQADCWTGNYLVRLGRPGEAVKYIQSAVALAPGSESYHFAFANALSLARQTDEAIVEYQKAVRLKPDFAEAQNNLAFSLLQLGRVNEAISHFQSAVEIQPTCQAYYNLGYALRQNRMAAEAVACFQKAIELDPQFMPAQMNLAWLLATWPEPSVRNGREAVALAEKANGLTKNPDPRILRTLAAAYAETGRFPEAVMMAKQALAMAVAQPNAQLTNALPAEIELYLRNSPCRSTNN